MISKLRKSARNQPCFVRITGVCNHDSATTVLAHLNGGGMGMKHSDLFGCFACSDCHAWLDGGWVKEWSREQRDLAHLEAIIRTQKFWLDNGFLKIND